jgi:hypothetical protein
MVLTMGGSAERSNETEKTGAKRAGENDIVLVQALVPMEKMGEFFQQERCFFS